MIGRGPSRVARAVSRTWLPYIAALLVVFALGWLVILERRPADAVIFGVMVVGVAYIAVRARDAARVLGTLHKNQRALNGRIGGITSELKGVEATILKEFGARARQPVERQERVHPADQSRGTQAATHPAGGLAGQLALVMSGILAPYSADRVGYMGDDASFNMMRQVAPIGLADKLLQLDGFGPSTTAAKVPYAAIIMNSEALIGYLDVATAATRQEAQRFFWRQRPNCDYILVSTSSITADTEQVQHVCDALGFVGAINDAGFVRLIR